MPYASDAFPSPTTYGNQRQLGNPPGEMADCGQYAARSQLYAARSIDPAFGTPQVQWVRLPRNFDIAHGLIGAIFRNTRRPINAQAMAYQNAIDGRFHYARFNGVISMTDGNIHHRAGMGGTFMSFSRGQNGQISLDNATGQRGAGPSEHLVNIAGFVDYCEREYGNGTGVDGLYYFCEFTPLIGAGG